MLASAGRDGTVRLWDPSTGEPIGQPLTGHDRPVRAVCAVPNPDGKSLLVSAGEDGTVRLWDARTGESLRHVMADNGLVWALCAVPDRDGRTLLGQRWLG